MSRKRDHNDTSDSSTSAKLPRSGEVEVFQKTSEVGILESISMKNFMCHNWLDLKFCPNVNFIIGKNGSGKSAIMTAVVIGLGGKASSTNRGTNAQSFIKNQKTAAEISICLRNEGPESYKPDLFGDRITVERKLVSAGAGSYKLKNSKGKVVSSKKEDLNNMLDFFNIQLDNPISLLNQEWSRCYLNSKNPQAKYKFFMKATQLEQLKEDYVLTNQKKESAKQSLAHKEENLQLMEAQVNEYKQQYEHHLSLQGLNDKLRHLQKECVWAQVTCMEQTIAKCSAEIDRRREVMTKIQSKLDEANGKESALKTEYSSLKDSIKLANQGISTLQRELDDAKKAMQFAKENQRKVQHSSNSIRAKLDSVKKEHLELRKKIEDLEKREDMTIQRQMKSDEVKRLEEVRAEIEDEIRHVDKSLQEKRALVEKYREDKNKLDQELRQLVARLNNEKRNLAEMKQGKANHLNRFGQFVPELLSRINAAYDNRVFQKKPIGPIGAYISLKDPSWTLAAETCLRPVLTSFLCDNQADSRQLERIMRELIRGRQIPSIIVARFKESVYDVAQFKADTSRYPSIYDIVKVDDPNVMNCLIDSRRIESILLIADNKEARSVMNNRNPPRNCNQAYTASGDQLFPSPSFRYYSCFNTNATLLQNNVEDSIQAMERYVRELEGQVQQMRTGVERTSRSVSDEDHEARIIQTQLMKLRENLSQTRMKITEIINSDEGENTDIAVFEEEETRTRQQVIELEQELVMKKQDDEECQQKVRECVAKCKEVDARLQAVMSNETDKDNLVKCGKDVEEASIMSKHFMDKIQLHERELAKLVDANSKRDNDLKAVAESDALGERFEATHTVEQCDSEITKIEKRLRREAELTGGDKEEMLQRYVESRTTYQAVRRQVVELAKFLKTFDATMAHRNERFLHIRNLITMRVQFAFSSTLMYRQYQGNLKIDHDKQTLEITVQTNKTTMASSDVRTLSGGERSFSTVALVVSLWNATESPFRMMDEFDIFMDLVNRQITMRMMMETAKDQSYRQFIFLTPLNMTSLQASNMVRIHHLKDPDRAQGVLPYRPEGRNGEEDEEAME